MHRIPDHEEIQGLFSLTPEELALIDSLVERTVDSVEAMRVELGDDGRLVEALRFAVASELTT